MKMVEGVMITFLLLSVASINEGKKGPECDLCKDVVANFKKGLLKTRMVSNYGGANSEARLIEIMEGLCMDTSEECEHLLEEHEEDIEAFWFDKSLKNDEKSFHNYFCIEKVKACCPEHTVGPKCEECPGGKDRPCSGNGQCLGAGSRSGSGKCKCNSGYDGKVCDNCADGFRATVKNDLHTVCTACHPSCKKTCTGYGPKDCDECKEGWTYHKDHGCIDVNECISYPCKRKEFCNNTIGSFSCISCDPACAACHGPGHDDCRWCSDGYLNKDNECFDIDECKSDGHEELCTTEGEECENTPGSYTCICTAGFMKDSFGTCVPLPSVDELEEPVPDEPLIDEKIPNRLVKNRAPRQFKCDTCKDLAVNFKLGLDMTEKANYGGGDTDWEETRLRQYSKSEIRLLEIMDNLCFAASDECPFLLEAYEHLIEKFWFHSGLEKDGRAFYKFFCVENVKACCANNTYGPNCEECNGGKERPCTGNGECDGAGTRQGTGKCSCNVGYEGDLCDYCTIGFYESDKNETHTVCKACDKSCKSSCTGEGPTGCIQCSSGWIYDKEAGCQDIDECAAEGHEDLCTAEGQQCENTPGAYICTCQPGYVKDGLGACKVQPEDVISSDKEGAGESDGDAGDEDGSVEESQGEESPEPVDGESSDTIPDSTDTQKDEL